MTTTLELLRKALEIRKPAEWARRYNITQATFNNAKTRGFLSPMLAGNLAIDLGEDANHWIALAALESERDSPLKDRLKDTLKRQKSYLLELSKLIAKQSSKYSSRLFKSAFCCLATTRELGRIGVDSGPLLRNEAIEHDWR